MTAAQTSIEAYQELTDLPSRRAQVLAVLSRGPASNATIARTLNLPLHCVTGRRVITWEVVE